MTPKDTLAKLKAFGNDATYKHNKKAGAGDKQFGVKAGDIRKIAATIKTDHKLALALWDTGNADAQLLAVLVLDPKKLSADDLDRLVRSITFSHVADWLHSYVTKSHPDKEALRQKWLADGDRWAARAGWGLTAGRIEKSPDGLDVTGILDRVEAEMPAAAPEVQWTMNACLANIGIHFPKLRKRALAVGETLGVYRDYPVSKGCISPFAPIWINEMVKRNAAAK
jgi:3-methyladenine DNA glycosylase AlkD